MWLLSTLTGELKEFDKDPPDYAILSHVWGDSEQKFQDVKSLPLTLPLDSISEDLERLMNDMLTTPDSSLLRPGLSPKIRRACVYARLLGFEWIWIDTCCIDKTSSAELSEAINSMFLWYSKASLCIAYLEDVQDPPDSPLDVSNGTTDHSHPTLVPEDGLCSDFTQSRWFDRGWTLQELVAPRVVEFVSRGWKKLGTKMTMAKQIEERTHIDAEVLRLRRKHSDVCIAHRMQWAARRQTTRVEDRAYSLLGIFDVTMTTLYGEGWAAFRRLQEEIMVSSSDQTLFVWNRQFRTGRHGPLARTPEDFLYTQSLSVLPVDKITMAVAAFRKALMSGLPPPRSLPGSLPTKTPSFTKTSHGVRAWIPLIQANGKGEHAIAVLAVQQGNHYLGLTLQRTSVLSELPHYSILDGLIGSTHALSGWKMLCGSRVPDKGFRIKWTEIYLTNLPPRRLTPRAHIKSPVVQIEIPVWVIAKMARRYGFFLSTGSSNQTGGSIHAVTLVRGASGTSGTNASPRNSPRHLRFTSVDPHTRRSETLQLTFDHRPVPHSVDLGRDHGFCTVMLNGRYAKAYAGPTSTEPGDRTLWFGDRNRAIGIMPLPGDSVYGWLDIDLSGKVYARCGQVYRRCGEIALVDDSPGPSDPPSEPIPQVASTATGHGSVSEISMWRMIDTAVAPVQTELADTTEQVARLTVTLAQAHTAIEELKKEVHALRQARQS